MPEQQISRYSRKGSMDWSGQQLCPTHQRILEFLFRHGRAHVEIIGEAADPTMTPRTDRKYWTGTINRYDRSAGRIGAASLIWLTKWGFVRRSEYDKRMYWSITDKGRQALFINRGGSR